MANGDNGPASRWANNAAPGSFLGFSGPSTPKLTHFEADWYLVAADPSALPVAAAALEAIAQIEREIDASLSGWVWAINAHLLAAGETPVAEVAS